MRLLPVVYCFHLVCSFVACSSEEQGTRPVVDAKIQEDAWSFDAGAEEFAALRVLTLNLRNNEDYWEDRFDLIASQLDELRPHIFGAQELQIGDDQTQELFKRLEQVESPLRYYVYEELKSGVFDILGEGLAIYSSFPFEQTDVLPLGEGRIALFARVRLPNGSSIDVYNVHVHYASESQVEQVTKVLAWIEERSKGHDVVLLGDFNALPESEAYALAADRFTDAWLDKHPDEPGFTFPIKLSKDNPTQAPKSRIDYVFYHLASQSPWVHQDTEVTFDQAAPSGLMASDHLGVTSSFVLER